MAAEHEFNVWRASVATRNAEKIRSAEMLGALPPGFEPDDATLERIWGRSRFLYLQQSAEHLPVQADAVIARLRQAIANLHDALTRTLPGHDFQVPLDPKSPEYQARVEERKSRG
jgi:hypothetical protein